MWAFVGDENLWQARLGELGPEVRERWTLVSASEPLPPAAVYLDLAGQFAQNRPSDTAAAWWLVHAPEYTLAELPPQTIRINGWPGFTQGADWEVVVPNATGEQICSEVLASLGKQAIAAPDHIGGVGARVLASIINEAYLLHSEGSASRSDIDQAMKLGTNYPMGPFEWSEQIGPEAVHALLKRLSETEPRYEPAAALKQTIDTP